MNDQQVIIEGLCKSCVKADSCVYLRKATQPIVQCEEFEGFISRNGHRPVHVKRKPQTNLDCKVKGLCRTCANYKDCVYPKNEGGVWFCDEYK